MEENDSESLVPANPLPQPPPQLAQGSPEMLVGNVPKPKAALEMGYAV